MDTLFRQTTTVEVHFGVANLSSTVDAVRPQKSHLQHTEAKAEATRRPFLSCAACEESEQRHPARRCWPAAGPAPLVLLTLVASARRSLARSPAPGLDLGGARRRGAAGAW